MKQWVPHVTVACVVEQDGRYLLVEERDKTSVVMVFNQPAGHLEANETLTEAAIRETREETGWSVDILGVLGIALFTAPGNGITYHRTTFVAKPLAALANAVIDPDIDQVHWLQYEEILDISDRMRSPLVIFYIERYRSGIVYPLDIIKRW